jgi:hypothetical protein
MHDGIRPFDSRWINFAFFHIPQKGFSALGTSAKPSHVVSFFFQKFGDALTYQS